MPAAIAAVGWSLVAMAGVAALGLHLLGADATGGSLGPMTAAVVVLAVGGSVTPSGDVSAFGLEGAAADTAVDITPLGVGLAGALVLGFLFLRTGGAAGRGARQLLARGAAVTVLFVATAGGLAWVGHDAVTLDGLELPGSGGGGGGGPGGLELPGIGDLGDLGGLLPDRVGDLVDAKARVGFTVDTVPTLWGAAVWVVAVLVVAACAGRRRHPSGALLSVVRPVASAVVAVLLVTVVAGLAAAGWAAAGDGHPERIAGAALLGAPNATWLAVPLGMLVPFDGRATGELARVLPDPLDELLAVSAREPVTVGRLAGYDGRAWLLVVAVAAALLYAGVLAAVRSPRVAGPGGFALRGAARMGVAWALVVPVLVWLTRVSVDASLSVLGVDAFGAGVELRGRVGPAVVLGGVWGAVSGGVGALVAWRWARAPVVRAVPAGVPGCAGVVGGAGAGWPPGAVGPYRPSPVYGEPGLNPYRGGPGGAGGGPGGAAGTGGAGSGAPGAGGYGSGGPARGGGPGGGRGAGGGGTEGGGAGRDVSGEATIAGTPPPWPRRPGGADRSADETIAGPPPPPPPRRRPVKPPFTPPPPPGPPPSAPRPPESTS
ncbi:streptophobe family protein [Streptomyces sp. NPDC101132]|uniref:streptophobe family protein n=1 Tax=Streptomyces sp. NPDC101132 TaxID=3366110 RepID=UPI00381B1D21